MKRLIPLRLFSLLMCCCVVSFAAADDASPKSASDKPGKAAPADKEEEPKSPPPTKVSGVFEALKSAEIMPTTEQIASMEIKRLVDHGSRIKKDQNVVVFDTEAIDKQIKNAEIDLRLAKLSMDDDEFNHQQFLETQKLDRGEAERTRKNAQQAYDNFAKVDRERQILSAEFSLKSSKASLANVTEELKQLQQMYEEDDLTEESEEIVLKRAKQAVESAQFRLEGTEINTLRTLNQSIPNSQADQESRLAKANLAYAKSIRDLNSSRQRKEIELNRKRDKFKEQEKKLAELKAERKQITLQAPFAGIVLHGKLNRGRLSDKPATLKVGSKVTPRQVVATIVDPSRLQIRVTLEEKHLSVVKAGVKCKVTCAAFPDFQADGTVKSVSSIAYVNGKYDCVVSFRTKNQPDVMPTMACSLEFAAIEKKDAK